MRERTGLIITLVLASFQLAYGQVKVENAFPSLTFSRPTDIQEPGDGTDRLFVVGQEGLIWVFQNEAGVNEKTAFLDIQGHVTCCGERGLLGLAFHPDYASNGYFFVNYTTTQNGSLRTRISRFQVSDSNPDEADPNSEVLLLEVNQPESNHNAGQLQFGSDGYLYIGLGDGGESETGQDPTSLLGSMLRLDVSGGGTSPDCGGGEANYTVPSSNPFVADPDHPAYCDEIYAYGFRNPFRFSFGPEGRLWLGDVGEQEWEEIDWVEAGKNYGWDTMEGAHCYNPLEGCDQTGLELPVLEYPHDAATGGRSVTGGYVSQGGCSFTEGTYIYGDFISGNIWSAAYDESGVTDTTMLVQNSGLTISTFGAAPGGALLMTDYGISDGALYRFNCSALPVELTSFDARLDGKAANLIWETASETNNAGFEVQHAPDGSFKQIGFVEGAGTTTAPQRYSFAVHDLSPGTHRFRLKQIDLDGSHELSSEVEVLVGVDGSYQISPVYPNPFESEGVFTISVSERQRVRIGLFDALGRRVAVLHQGQMEPRETRQIELDGSGLASGVYIIQIRGERFSTTRKVVVRR